jgi:hypothetical protein
MSVSQEQAGFRELLLNLHAVDGDRGNVVAQAARSWQPSSSDLSMKAVTFGSFTPSNAASINGLIVL